jgi:hypothetical protein
MHVILVGNISKNVALELNYYGLRHIILRVAIIMKLPAKYLMNARNLKIYLSYPVRIILKVFKSFNESCCRCIICSHG